MKINSISTTLRWYWCSFQKSCQISIQLERLLIKSRISFFTREFVSGLLPKWGSAPALQRATTHSRRFFHAAMNRGELSSLFKRFSSALAAKRIGTAAGFLQAAIAICRGDSFLSSRALIAAPASINALTTEPDLSNRAAKWRAVCWNFKECNEKWYSELWWQTAM